MDLVRISRPRYTQGGRSAFQDKLAHVKERKGRRLTLVLVGETEPYMFWAHEVDYL